MFIRSFCGANAEGNTHRVIFRDATRKAIPPAQDYIDVEIAQENTQLQIHCARDGKPINYCGSGLLAAAHALQQQSLNSPIFANGRRLLFTHRNKQWGYKTARCTFLPGQRHHFWQRLIGAPVHALFYIGQQQGYALAILRSIKQIKTAKPNLRILARCSRRALIISAPAQGKTHYVMRYFAPQYGVDEDAATGSANGFLMQYWARQLGKKRLVGQQLSRQGGLFYGSYQPPFVTLFGNTRLIT